MRKNFTLLFLFFFLTQLVVAQSGTEKWIKGQVSSNGIPVEGINIMNTSTKASAVSDSYGSFSILAKEGDILNFSAVDYEDLRKYVKVQEFRMGTVIVDLTPKSIQLDEVVIKDYHGISAESLGIPTSKVKLTPAERRLYTAGDFKLKDLFKILVGGMPFDPVLNAINGRTKMLKKELSVEKKEFLMAKLEGLFEDKYYIETLKIPEDFIKGFQYYCIEDQDFVRSLNEKNKTMSMFLIVGMADSFNKNRESNLN
ncbi:carboxypeptidase-like regulatory domain-containing protein [Flavobacterium gilvum]|uniref:carboxypeptidase-like regulatory domain-containing protein n=1 Tax=Flavobacterium gilvum TaxID=1492737 RepID=UPI000A7C906E|nr:carboxypeptidase-like regulatory domain-containing protein [Flavobacterium gilvum]